MKTLKITALVAIVLFSFILFSNKQADEANSKFGKKRSEICDYLSDMRVKTHKSNNPSSSGLVCLSDYIDIDAPDSAKLANNIAYYVQGNKETISGLKIVSNFNQPNSKHAEKTTQTTFNLLLTKSVNLDISKELNESIKSKTSKEWNKTLPTGENIQISFVFDKWPNEGYEMKLLLK
ncbi:hypothetical protein [Vibrio rumoiensis]|uniref:hypothetical protein n=1 Tax=Vibrio rumoiensis TaxID=76258 RepID=UPI003AA80242